MVRSPVNVLSSPETFASFVLVKELVGYFSALKKSAFF